MPPALLEPPEVIADRRPAHAGPEPSCAAEPPGRSTILISPRAIARVLAIVVGLFTIASLAGRVYKFLLVDAPNPYVLRAMAPLNLDRESSIPAWYSVLALGSCAILLLVITLVRRRERSSDVLQWGALSAIFFLLSYDEGHGKLHETKLDFLMPSLGSDFVHFWVIPMFPLVVGFALIYWRFLFRLPPSVRNAVALAGCLYVGGALGMELVGGLWAEAYGKQNFTYMMLSNTEELLEMSGVVVFLYALLSYLGTIVESARFERPAPLRTVSASGPVVTRDPAPSAPVPWPPNL